MVTRARQLVAVALGAVVLFGVTAPGARAQANLFDPYGIARRAAFNIMLYGQAMRQVPPYALGYNPYPPLVAGSYGPAYVPPVPVYGGGTLVNVPAAGYVGSPGLMTSVSPGYSGAYDYGSYYPYSYFDPYGGFLRGTADVIRAEGRFRVDNMQSKLMFEQVRQARIETKRRAIDEWLYERANLPTWQDERERLAKLELRYHLTNPADTDIYSATSLNNLLDQLQRLQAKGGRGPTVPLEDDLLRQINVTTGSGGNIGLLKNDGRLNWTLGLMSTPFDESRKAMERELPLAIRELETHGQVGAGRLKTMMAEVDKMYETLASQIGEMAPSQYIEAKRYLGQLSQGLRALQNPDASNYFTGKYVARGKSVGELVKNMSGLKFAPAMPGEEKAYRELYQAMVAYYTGAQQTSRD